MVNDTVSITTDVLVIGGGFAGCQAALRARDFIDDVTLVDKAVVSRSGASAYAHTHLAPWKLSDAEKDEWAKELAESSNFLADQNWIQALLQESSGRIDQLLEWGIPYERDEKGNLQRAIIRGHRNAKSISVDGMKVQEILKHKLKAKGVRLLERVMMTNLLTSDGLYPTKGQVIGTIGIGTRTGTFYNIKAKSVVLATGPFFPKIRLCYCDHLTGEGQLMAAQAGARMTGLEFAIFSQFSYWERKFITPGQAKMQGFGAKIVNSCGERIMNRHNPEGMELLASLTHISAAIAAENLDGNGPCYFDMRHFSNHDLASIRIASPFAMKAFDEFGIDLKQQQVETNPLVGIGSSNNAGGGPIVDLNCKTNVPNLFAAGAVTTSPCMVAGRAGSLPSTFAHVSGYKAGEAAAKNALDGQYSNANADQVDFLRDSLYQPLEKKSKIKAYDVYYAVNSYANKAANIIFKNNTRINETLNFLNQIEDTLLPEVSAPDIHELVKAIEAKSFVYLSKLHFLSALAREESRDPHYRTDYFCQDDMNWLKWVVVTLTDGGKHQLENIAVPLDTYPYQPPSFHKQPIPLQIPVKLREERTC